MKKIKPMGRGFLGVCALWLAACAESAPPPSVLPPAADAPDSEAPSGIDGASDCLTPQPLPAPLQLLTRAELDFTLRDLVGETRALAHELLPPENSVLGFENNAAAHQISPLFLESMLVLAERVSETALADRPERLHPCIADAAARGWQLSTAERDACRDDFISEFTQRAFRRPVNGEEAQIVRGAFDALAETPDTAFAAALQAVLLSPRFLYRVREVSPNENSGGFAQLSAHELAERLSYLLWRSMPDDELFAAANSGALLSEEGLLAQVNRMWRDPKTLDMSHDFHRQWLHLDAFENLRKDLPSEGPDDIGALTRAWRESLLHFADDALFREGANGVDALLSSPSVWLADSTASLYGFAGQTGPVDFPADQRAGLVTQPGLLALLAHAEQTSPIHRGIFVREKLLCEQLPPPPPDLVITPPSPDPNSTTRERFAAHTEEESCQGCHVLIDPIGFGFEGYDALGRFRQAENGLPIDDSGELLYTWSGDAALEGPFSGAVQLAHRLADAPQVRDCIATQWWRFSLARGEGSDAERCSLEQAKAGLRDTGQVTDMIQQLILSDAFRSRPGLELPSPTALPETGNMTPGTGDVSGDSGGDDDGEPPVSIPGDPEPQSPLGYLDHIDDSGVVSGWALDPNAPGYALNLHVYVDGPAGQGTMLPIAPRAQYDRPDVILATGYPGEHGFVFQLPTSLGDGQSHSIYVYAIDTGSSPNILLPGSPKQVRINGGDATPRGHVDSIGDNGVVVGWSFDPSTPSQAVEVEFYLDEPWYRGVAIGSTRADRSRPDVNQVFGVQATAGFQYTLPPSARDGQNHILYVVARDIQNPSIRVGIGNPMSFQVAP